MSGSHAGRFAVFLACVCAAASVLGCGSSSSPAKVSGKVTLNGRAPRIKGLQISFLGSNGRMYAFPINEDGTYSAEDVPAGETTVAFLYVDPSVVPVNPGQGRGPGVRPDKAGPKNNDQSKNPIPEPLRDGSTSKITFKVESGQDNVFNYDIKS